MTAFGEVKLAVEAIKAGAFDFLEKPIDLEYLRLVIARALNHRKLVRDRTFREDREQERGVQIIGRSDGLRKALDMAEKVGPSNTSCLLLGETGRGQGVYLLNTSISKVLEQAMRSFPLIAPPFRTS